VHNDSAAIFVSIHSNAAPNNRASGIETFFFDVSRYCTGTDKPTRLVSALFHDRRLKSELLAHSIHESVLAHARNRQPGVIDRKVKQTFLQVLAGAAVPAALVELGFLTNLDEASLINDKHYKMLLASGICEGIIRYLEHN
jgi:N-acetylmuramoyl-L-alanine amidase